MLRAFVAVFADEVPLLVLINVPATASHDELLPAIIRALRASGYDSTPVGFSEPGEMVACVIDVEDGADDPYPIEESLVTFATEVDQLVEKGDEDDEEEDAEDAEDEDETEPA